MTSLERVVLLTGGVGGARLLDGLAAALGPSRLTAIVNVGDDFEHLGLHISPDLDTCLYTLAGLADEARGWGVAGETFAALERLSALGEDDFFQLGDRDLATHLFRTRRLRRGARLTEVTRELCERSGVRHALLPATDAPRPTLITTRERGEEHFQEWLVRHRAEGEITEVRFSGAPPATPEALDAIERATLVVVAPSNPFVSIEPILSLEGVRERVAATPSIGVSPIVAGAAVKGPLAQMIPALMGCPPSAAAVAARYADFLRAFVVERGDAPSPIARTFEASIVMRDRAQRARLAREVLAFAEEAFG